MRGEETVTGVIYGGVEVDLPGRRVARREGFWLVWLETVETCAATRLTGSVRAWVGGCRESPRWLRVKTAWASGGALVFSVANLQLQLTEGSN
jgi:hypothetical protein